MSVLDPLPYSLLIFIALFMLGSPFVPEPHLVQKWKMLRSGTLRRPVDVLDVVFHLAPTVLLGLKIARDISNRG